MHEPSELGRPMRARQEVREAAQRPSQDRHPGATHPTPNDDCPQNHGYQPAHRCYGCLSGIPEGTPEQEQLGVDLAGDCQRDDGGVEGGGVHENADLAEVQAEPLPIGGVRKLLSALPAQCKPD